MKIASRKPAKAPAKRKPAKRKTGVKKTRRRSANVERRMDRLEGLLERLLSQGGVLPAVASATQQPIGPSVHPAARRVRAPRATAETEILFEQQEPLLRGEMRPPTEAEKGALGIWDPTK